MIRTSLSSSIRRPLTSVEFDIVAGKRGLTPTQRRLVVIGAELNAPAWATAQAKVLGDFVTANGNVYRCTAAGNTAGAGPGPVHTAGSAVDGTVTWLYVQPALTGGVGVIRQVFSETDAEAYWGRGSELALAMRAAIKGGAKRGAAPELYGVSLADAGGATRVSKTETFSGAVTEAGDIAVRISGRVIRAGVAKDMTAAQAAAEFKAAVDTAVANLPVTASIAGAVVTLRGNNGGPNGNDIKVETVSLPKGLALAHATPTPGASAYDITASLDALVDKRYHAVAIGNHTAADVADAKVHIANQNAPTVKRFTTIFLAETGSLATATTLATTSNDFALNVITAEDFPWLPIELAAYVAALIHGETDSAHNFDGQELDVPLPLLASSLPIHAEIESALANGATPLAANENGSSAVIVRFVTTKTSHNGVPYYELLDGSAVRQMFDSAEQVDVGVKLALVGAKRNERTRKLIHSAALRRLRQLEEIGWLHNVEAHKGELSVEPDSLVPTRYNMAVPLPVTPDLHQVAQVYTLFVE